MKKWMFVLIVAFVLSMNGGVLYATLQQGGTPIPNGNADRQKKDTLKKEEIKKTTAYDKLFQDKPCRTVKSKFITLHKIEDKLYFEFPLAYLNKEMLLSSTPSEVSNNLVCEVGLKSTLYVRFTKNDTLICLRRINSSTTSSDKDKVMHEAIRRNTLDPILGSYKIVAYTPDSLGVVFDVSGIFLRDNEWLPLFPEQSGMFSVSARLGKGEPFWSGMKAFDDNLTIKTTISYNVSLKYMMFSVFQDDVTVVATRSLLLLPEDKMRPRFSDSRVGIFLKNKRNISQDKDGSQPYSLANRWRVEPKDKKAYKKGVLVEPVKPIVFYLDDAFPKLWKEAITEGTLRWNEAFEKIGFKNVVQVKDYPKDDPTFDPDNVKYSCIRFIPSSTENAMGPSFIDPSTGEILAASVLVYSDVVRLINNWRFVQTAQVDPSVRASKMPDKIMKESIAYVVAHEVGHTLGFMHNMAASSAYSVDSLRSADFTRKYGTTPSIMDYARFNYVAQPGDKGVRLTPPDLGIYDDFLVKWNYHYFPSSANVEEEAAILEKWVDEKAGDPRFRYGRQQIYCRYDPSALEEDLGDDPMKAGSYGIANLNYILTNMDKWITDDPDGRHKEELFGELSTQYYRYIRNVMYNIGGIYLTSVKEGTSGTRFQSVPRAVQKASFAWVMNEFRRCGGLDHRELNRKRPLRVNTSLVLQDRIARGIKRAYLGVMLSAHVAENDPYTVAEFFEDYYDEAFASLSPGSKLTDGDKMLQNMAIDLISETLSSDTKGKGLFGFTSMTDAYSPSFEDIMSYRLDESGLFERYKNQFQEIEQEWNVKDRMRQSRLNRLGSGYEWQEEISTKAIDRSKACIYAMALKIKDRLESELNTASGDSRAHYQTLLFTLNQVLKK